MNAFTFNLKSTPDFLEVGLTNIRPDHPGRFGAGKGALALTFLEDTMLGQDSLAATATCAAGSRVGK